MLSALKRGLRARKKRQRLSIVRELLGGQTLKLVDVGAAYGVERRWRPFSSVLDYVGFEPEARAFGNIANPDFRSYTIINKALWSSNGPLPIHICRGEGRSSALAPNRAFIDRFSEPERLDVTDIVTVPAARMDSVIDRCDFIKIDTQGAELDILKGSTGILQQCIGLEIEVEFSPIYKDVPLFAPIDTFMIEQGFELVDFADVVRWEVDRYTDVGQLAFADALYLRREPIDSPQYRAILAIYDRFDRLDALMNGKWTGLRDTEQRKRRLLSFVRSCLDVF